MTQPSTPLMSRPLIRYALLIALPLLAVVAWFAHSLYIERRDAAVLRMPEIQLQANPELLAYASSRAAPLYQQHCASCHGADLQGDRRKGAPNLKDKVWLYENGELSDIEQTILYGIRSGHPKSRNLTDMPGMGRQGLITPAEINDVVEFVLLISKQPADAEAAKRGGQIFATNGLCYDCHGSDGAGDASYGAPGLLGRGDAWLNGGDRATLRKSVFDGRHGLCPAWIHTLSFTEIRALAAFIYNRSHAANSPTPPPAGT